MATVVNLADAGAGARFVVKRILFDGPRAVCGREGLGTGDRLELVERGRGGVLVRAEGGRLIRCPLDVACYVEVEEEGAETEVEAVRGAAPPEGAGVD